MPRHDPTILIAVVPVGQQEAVRVDVSDRVISFEYEDVEDKADQCRIRLDNWDLTDLDDPIWQKGNMLEVTWGYAEALAPPRLLEIRKIDGFQELSIEAHGIEATLNVQARTRVFEHMSRSEVALQIAREHGYVEPDLLHVQETEIQREAITQASITDALMLRRLAAQEGFEWYIDFDGFHFHARSFAQRPVRVFEWRDSDSGFEKSILKLDVEQDPNGKRKRVTLKSRDPLSRSNIVGTADDATETARNVLGEIQEVPGDGPGTVSARGTSLVNVATGAVFATPERTARGAQRAAAAKFRDSQQHAVRINMEAIGDPNVLAKSIIEIRGIGKRFSQAYYVKSVKHVIRSGYTIKLEMVSDGSGGHSTKSVRANEASAIHVGPGLSGRKLLPPVVPAREKQAIELTPELRKRYDDIDADKQARTKFQDPRKRELPPSPAPATRPTATQELPPEP